MELTFSTSPDTTKLDASLSRVQAGIPAAVKDKVNPAFRSKYADLTSIWDACRGALAAEGISLTQWPVHSDDGRLHLVTRIAAFGQWIMAESSIPVSKQDPQGFGSALTYCKRYAIASALGVVAEDDDDGEAASRPKVQPMEIPARNPYGDTGGKPSDAPGPGPASPPAQKNARDGFSVDELVGKGEHKALSWRALAAIDKGPGYIRYVLDKWTTLSPAARTALQGLLDAPKAGPLQAIELQDALNRAATVEAISIDQSAGIEEVIERGDSDEMRIALDWLGVQIEKKRLGGTPADRWQPA